MPNAKLFPFESVQAKLKTGETIELSGHQLDLALQYSASVSPTIKNNINFDAKMIYCFNRSASPSLLKNFAD